MPAGLNWISRTSGERGASGHPNRHATAQFRNKWQRFSF
jgi:hypothetical protein